ncbi:baeRF3 domain-containing protein [Flavobacterium lacus]|uniref:Peptide subunit release factor 1 (ERF1) n=1 Tax=Flavobacterium lacus TaxID=1353778 RepID=A0A328WUT1_9FLAO|nr:hypothetical protein [Flavobacterium lacus]RAR47614.1 hypothetical protein B0I10_108117 [Flavobacterium lacus]
MKETAMPIQKVSHEIIQKLLSPQETPCLSLYMTTHQHHPENAQDPIRFQNLMKELEESLAIKYDNATIKNYLAPLEQLKNDSSFWRHTAKGLAIFSAGDFFEVIGLQTPPEELAIVADSFHTKPLRQYTQTMDHFHVVGVTMNSVRLYEGSHHYFTEIDLDSSIPQTMEDALGEELTDKHTTVASYGGTSGHSVNMRHGHGGKKEEIDNDVERFFRIVAQEVYEKYSKPTGWPLILVALSEHHSVFHKVNKNAHLLHKGIKHNPSAISVEELKNKAWEIMEPEYIAKIEQQVDKYNQARATDKGSDDLKTVSVAAVEGRIDTLLIEADRIIAKRITNLETGNTQNKDINNPRVDDLLDDMSELVTKMGGTIYVIPSDQMPTENGFAAILRY